MRQDGTLSDASADPDGPATARRRFAFAVLWAVLAATNPPVHSAAAPTGAETLAVVGERVITVQEYAMALRTEVRRRFYHAKPRESELAAFHREVANQLVDRSLAAQEARRRGIRADNKAIDAQIRKIRERVGQRSDEAHDNRAFWEALRRQIAEQQLADRLKAREREALRPDESALRGYYREHPDKFTQPEQVRVSVILLRVSPSSPKSAWEAARREADGIHSRLREGADFAELARLHSSDRSAASGGDLGYVHKGMLSAGVEEALATAKPGAVTEPLMVLEGIAIFKLLDRKPPTLLDFARVRDRVAELWTQEEERRGWDALMSALRSNTRVTIEEKYLAPG